MPVNILTQRNAPDRRGINRDETQLNPDNVRFDNFSRIGSYPVTGSVYAQPLYVSGVNCGGAAPRDLVIVATMDNRVYAFAADQEGDAARIWPDKQFDGVKIGPSVPTQPFQNGNYGDFYRKTAGILSTPVIELNGATPSGGVIYLVSFQFDEAAFAANQQTATPAMFKHELCALDLGTGTILRRAVIKGSYPGAGYTRTSIPPWQQGADNDMVLGHPLNRNAAARTASMTIGFGNKGVEVIDVTGVGTPDSAVQFNSIMQLQRPGLLLQDDTVCIAFGSRGDEDPYHGWLFSYDKNSFEQTGVFCTTPNGGRGGMWQAGQGLIRDSKKNIYVCTGNGDNDKPGTGPLLLGRNLGESFLGFRLDPTGLRLNGWFCLFKDFDQHPAPETSGDERDDDFGAGAPALLPDDRIVAGGKDGWFFLIDPDQLDKSSSRDAVPQAFKASFNVQRGSRIGNKPGRTTRHIHGSPVVWDDGAGHTYVYVWGENDVVRVYQYTPETHLNPSSGRFVDQPKEFDFGTEPLQGIEFARGNIYASNEVADRHGMPGGFLSLSVNGADPSTGILWAAYPPYADANQGDVVGRVAAYAAADFDGNLAYKRLTLLWHSGQNPGDDVEHFAKFCVPTVANGRLYQATGSIPEKNPASDGTPPPKQRCEVVIYGLRAPKTTLKLGFDGGGFSLNGSARVSEGGGVVLTDAPHGNDAAAPTFSAGSIFSRKTADITRFVTEFTFQLTEADADGFAFVIQAEGPRAIGSPGSGVGYAVDVPSTLGRPEGTFTPVDMQSTILHSFAVKFRLRDDNGNPASLVALMVNGAPLPGFADMNLQQNPGSIDLHGGHPIKATLRYDGNVLFVTLRDLNTNSASPDFALLPGNIAQQINSVQGQAFVGFTGGTGGLSARQEILAWTFREGVSA